MKKVLSVIGLGFVFLASAAMAQEAVTNGNIKFVYYKTGRQLTHPSGVVVFEPVETQTNHLARLDMQIARLQSRKVKLLAEKGKCDNSKEEKPVK